MSFQAVSSLIASNSWGKAVSSFKDTLEQVERDASKPKALAAAQKALKESQDIRSQFKAHEKDLKRPDLDKLKEVDQIISRLKTKIEGDVKKSAAPVKSAPVAVVAEVERNKKEMAAKMDKLRKEGGEFAGYLSNKLHNILRKRTQLDEAQLKKIDEEIRQLLGYKKFFEGTDYMEQTVYDWRGRAYYAVKYYLNLPGRTPIDFFYQLMDKHPSADAQKAFDELFTPYLGKMYNLVHDYWNDRNWIARVYEVGMIAPFSEKDLREINKAISDNMNRYIQELSKVGAGDVVGGNKKKIEWDSTIDVHIAGLKELHRILSMRVMDCTIEANDAELIKAMNESEALIAKYEELQ